MPIREPEPGLRQNLIIDADDTLWENNVYFEDAFDDFCEFLSHSTLKAGEIRAILDEIERANSKVHGYGSLNFGRNLKECYQRLCERHIADDDLDIVFRFAVRILEQPLQIIEGVTETLDYLAPRHNLILFTKGHPEEQKLKIDRSGLGVFFGHTEIVREKDVASYGELVDRHRLEPGITWMIGNSPRSDVNPALAAGLNAVFVPHDRTWTLEREELRSDGSGRLLTVERFSDLVRHF